MPGSITKKQFFFWLALPFIVYLIPVIMGYAWLPVGSDSQSLVSTAYPYGFTGREPAISPSFDPPTSSHYNIPYFYQLRSYIAKAELPLWNPNSGLGMPFAAMGEGSPYSPFSLLRAFIPPHYHDLITIFGFAVASVFFHLFLKELGLPEGSAFVGSALYSLQGAFLTTILIANVAQTISLFPLIFWTCMRVFKRRRRDVPVFTLSAAIFIASGHVQQAFLGLFALCLFAFFYSIASAEDGLRERLYGLLRVTAGVVAALLITAPYLLPVYEYITTGFHVHFKGVGGMSSSMLALNFMFDPLEFGGLGVSFWYDEVKAFSPADHLFFFGLTAFFAAVAAITDARRLIREARGVVILCILGVFILLKFIGAPFAIIRLLGGLPFFTNMGPKHYGAIISFLLIPAFATGLDAYRGSGKRRLITVLAASSVVLVSFLIFSLVWRDGFRFAEDWKGFALMVWRSLRFRLPIIAIALYAVAAYGKKERFPYAIVILVVVEAGLYVPLGLPPSGVTPVMTLLAASGALTAVFFSLERRVLTTASCIVVIILYGYMVSRPGVGLPVRQPLLKEPPHIAFLKRNAGDGVRTFGIQPSYSSVFGIQDFGTNQPVVPREFDFFVETVGGSTARQLKSLWFFLHNSRGDLPGYALSDYVKYKGAWDFFGLKYLAVNKMKCGRYSACFDEIVSTPGLKMVFEDDVAMIFESTAVMPKVMAASRWVIAQDAPASKDYVRQNASSLSSVMPVVEGGERPAVNAGAPYADAAMVRLLDYGSGRIRISTRVSVPHMLIVADNYDKGWRAYVDGQEAPVLRANFSARAVYVAGGGGGGDERVVEMLYRPGSFYYSLVLTAAGVALAVVVTLKRAL